eukprot:CAMPEP_0185779356 /NCGR_PEP_ID=MMETSP1174-20130828/95563_1 /TAXON_ID=35687 /ORGANISM="Dictyocha speculum, Strain CCMP1381" /LENGTH=1021 /DNA_ID=CAMNT_0028468473 /DNA_START=210 /DNA_END=3275 /DNA_ORIENTATION=+
MLASSFPIDEQSFTGGDESYTGGKIEDPKFRWVGEDCEAMTYAYEITLRKPLGMTLAEQPLPAVPPPASTNGVSKSNGNSDSGAKTSDVTVSEVTIGSNAYVAGVRVGDRIVATQATVGDEMWVKTTLDGVIVAVTSRLKYNDQIRLRLERPFDSAEELRMRSSVPETMVVELRKPLGFEVEERVDPSYKGLTAVFVSSITNNSEAADKLQVGDQITHVSGSFGDQLWATRSLEGVQSAVTTRLSQNIKIQVKRAVSVSQCLVDDVSPADAAVAAAGNVALMDDLELGSDGRRRRSIDTKEETPTEEEVPSPPDPTAWQEAAWREVRGALGETLHGVNIMQRIDPETRSKSSECVLMERSLYLVNGYARRDQSEARLAGVDQVLGTLLSSGVVPTAKIVNIAMIVYRKLGRHRRALGLYEASLKRGLTPSMECVTTYVSVISDPAALRSGLDSDHALRNALGAVDELRLRGGTIDVYVINALMRACVRLDALSRAHELFWRVMRAGGASKQEEMERPCAPDVHSFNIILEGYARQGDTSRAVATFRALVDTDDLTPDLVTYLELIKAFQESRTLGVEELNTALDILDDMEQGLPVSLDHIRADPFDKQAGDEIASYISATSFTKPPPAPRPNAAVYNIFVRHYCRRTHVDDASDVVERMIANGVSPDAMTFRYLLPGLVRFNRAGEALEAADAMQDKFGIEPDLMLYTTILNALSKKGDAIGAVNLLQKMKANGPFPNIKSFTAVMQACMEAKDPELALAVCKEMRSCGIEPDGVVYAILVDALCAQGDVSRAAQLIDSTRREFVQNKTTFGPTVSTYNALIRSAVVAQRWGIAIKALEDLLATAYPNDGTYTALGGRPQREDSVTSQTNAEGRSEVTRDSQNHAEFLLEVLDRLLEVCRRRSLVRLSGPFYTHCLDLCLKVSAGATEETSMSTTSLESVKTAHEWSDGTEGDKRKIEKWAEYHIQKRRCGELKVRKRDEPFVLNVESTWEKRLGKVFESSSCGWDDTVTLFDGKALTAEV